MPPCRCGDEIGMSEALNWIGENLSRGSGYFLWLFLATAISFRTLEKRPGWKARLALCSLPIILLCLVFPANRLMNRPMLAILWYVGAFVTDVLLVCWICRVSPEEAVYCAINGVFVEHIASSVQIILIAGVFQGRMEYLSSYAQIIYPLFYLLVWLLYRRMNKKREHIRISRWGIGVISIIGLTVTVVLSMLLKSNIDPELVFVVADPHSVIILITGQLYAIFFCFAMIILQQLQLMELDSREKLAMQHEMWSVRQKQFEMSRETIEMINQRCHDMKHQIAALMSEGEHSEERERYAQEIQRMIEIYDLQVKTDNEALNTILMEKGQYCRMHGIHWNCAVDDTDLHFIDRMDLYVLLGNALDNAIEAVEQVQDEHRRIIQLTISRKDDFVNIRLENSYEGELSWDGNLPRTTKEDKQSHGIGLRSIRNIAKKYGGYASASTEDAVFILSILIPIPKEQ